MIRRIFCFLLALIFIFPPSYRASATTLPSNSSRPALQLIQSNTAGVILDLSIPDYSPVADLMLTAADRQLSLPGYEFANDPGKPQLPLVTTMIGVPPDARLEMQIVADDAQLLPGSFRVPAAPTSESIQPGDLEESQSPALNYITDSSVYSSDASYPTSPVSLSSDAWVRDHRVVRISFYPFQYNPVQGSLTWHRNIRIEIRFYGDKAASTLCASCDAAASQPDPFGTVLQSSLINYDTATNWRSLAPAVSAAQAVINASQSSSPRYKITIDHDGIYQLSYNDLLQAGVDLAQVNPQNFHLTSQGQPVAMQITGVVDGKLGTQGTLTFYGQRFYGDRLAELYASEADNWITYTQQLTNGETASWHPTVTPLTMEKYTNDNVYWLEVGSSPGQDINKIDGNSTGSLDQTPAYFEKTVHVKNGGCSRCYYSAHFTGQEDIYMDLIQNTVTRSYTTTLTALASSPYLATVKAELVAINDNPSNSPDHHAQFFMNSATDTIQDIQWDGKSRYHMEVEIPQSMLAEGVNTLKFKAIHDSPTISPYYLFDWFEITYASLFQANNNIAAFSGDIGGAWKYQVGGFTTKDITIFDITEPLAPTQIINPVISDTSPYTVTFVASHAAGEKFIAVGSDGFQAPVSITSYQDHLTSINTGAEYVLIAPTDLIDATQALADYRQSTGLSTMVVNAGDVYNEYNFGIFNPVAFKNFFADAYNKWQIKPVYAVLVGDGNWNMRGFNPGYYGAAPIYMPPNLAWVDPTEGEVDSSNLLAAFVGNDPLPDLLISRMPVQNPGELYNILNKIVSYESAPIQDWQRRMLFVADNYDADAGDFANLSDEMIKDEVPDGFVADRIYLDDYYTSTVNGLALDATKCGAKPFSGGPACPAVNSLITETLSTTGTLFLTYTGHGSTWLWASEQILLYRPDDLTRTDDYAINNIDSLQNGTMLPVVLSLDCLDGYWIHPVTRPSLAELFLTSPNRGAVSTFSPTGYGMATGHDILGRGFYDEIFKNGNSGLGAASLAARLAVYKYGYDDELIETYTIFGDPALKIRSLRYWQFLPVVKK